MKRAVLGVAMSAMLACGHATTMMVRDTEPPSPPLVIELSRLDWPKLDNPEILVEMARKATAELKASGNATGNFYGVDHDIHRKLEVLGGAVVMPEWIALVLRTHPLTGQVLIVTAEPMAAKDIKLPRALGKVEDTGHPQIKYAILREPPRGDPAQFEQPVIRWKEFKNLDRDRTTMPWPRIMQPPSYPMEMLWAGIIGMAKLEFTVTKEGTVTGLAVTASHVEFEPVVREAAKAWRFEPGVDFVTRLPADTRLSLTIKFEIED